MRTKVLSLLGVMGLLVFGALTAHADELILRANIPFDFIVGSQTLPAGEYSIVKLSSLGNEYMMRNDNGSKAILFDAVTVEPKNTSDENAKLVFERYGDSSFLSDIWLGDSGLQLPKSRNERKLLAMGAAGSRSEVEPGH